MATATARKCSFCGLKAMIPPPWVPKGATTFRICPNCDSPEGTIANGNIYSGVGPER